MQARGALRAIIQGVREGVWKGVREVVHTLTMPKHKQLTQRRKLDIIICACRLYLFNF